MNQHFKKLVTRFFIGTLGERFLLLDHLDGTTGKSIYRYPLVIGDKLEVRIDEADLRSRIRRRALKTEMATLILRTPQELLKKDVRDWIEAILCRPLRLELLQKSLLWKIKSYRTGYKRLNRRKRARRAERISRDLQKNEKRFLEMRDRIREQNSHKC